MFKKFIVFISAVSLLGPASCVYAQCDVAQGETATVTSSISCGQMHIAGTLVVESTGSITGTDRSTLNGPGASITVNGGSFHINGRFNVGQHSDGYITMNGGTFSVTGTFKFPDDPDGVHRIYLNDGIMQSGDIELISERDAIIYVGGGILRLDNVIPGSARYDPAEWITQGALVPAPGFSRIIITPWGVSGAEIRGGVDSDGAWDIETVDSTADVGRSTSIALNAGGNARISYLDYTNSDLKYAASNGSAWDIDTVDSTGRKGWHSSLALDASGNPHISYIEWWQVPGEITDADVKYAAFNGSSWDIETVDNRGRIFWTSLALDADDNAHISYHWHHADYFDLNYAAWNGTAWDIETVDSAGVGASYSVGEYVSLALDADGNPHISYWDASISHWDLKYAAFNGSTWDIETVDSTGYVGEWTSLALDADGNAHISYYDTTNGDLKYAAFNGSAWDVESVDSTGDVGRYTSIALNADGNAHISYYDATNGDLKCAAWNGTAWDIETIDSTADVGQWTSLALHAGNAHISYYDATNGDLKYAFVFEPPITAIIDVDPDTLNKKSHGQWITAYITLPDGYNVADIDTSSIAITALVGESCPSEYSQAVDPSFTPQIGDRDEDGIPDLTVKFDRQLLIPNLCLDDVAITVEGKLTNERLFAGTDTIRVISRGK